MTVDEIDMIRLRVCSAVLTNNRRELEWAAGLPRDAVGPELIRELERALADAPVPGEHGIVRLTNYLPAIVQYVGQRAILLFPGTARRLLRASGLHHRMF